MILQDETFQNRIKTLVREFHTKVPCLTRQSPLIYRLSVSSGVSPEERDEAVVVGLLNYSCISNQLLLLVHFASLKKVCSKYLYD